MNQLMFSSLALTGYLLATGLLALRLWRGRPAGKFPALLCGLLGALAHTVVLYHAIFVAGGLDLGLSNTFSLVSWQIALILLLAACRQPVENLALPILPIGAISVLAIHWNAGKPGIITYTSWPLDAHILLSLLAYSLLAVAAMQALALAYQDYRLRHHQPGGLAGALPPLAIMENLLFQTLAAGFALLSLALFSGLIFVHDLFDQHLAHKTALSLLAWLVFAVLLWGRWKFGWRGRTAIRWTLGGFLTLMLAYFGSRLVLEVILGRHWG